MISASPLIVQLPPFSPNPQRPPPNRVRLSAAADRADFYEGEATAVNGYGRRRCGCFDLYKELVPYKEAWSWQKSLVRKRHSLIDTNEDHCDMLIILQHPPVYTLGTGSLEKYLNFNIQNAPYDVYRTERGGEVTYHGPGQFMQGYNCSECTYELYPGLVERRRYLSILLLTAEWRNMIHVDDPK